MTQVFRLSVVWSVCKLVLDWFVDDVDSGWLMMVAHTCVCVTMVDDVDSGWLMMVAHVCVTVVDDVDSGWLMMVARVCVCDSGG